MQDSPLERETTTTPEFVLETTAEEKDAPEQVASPGTTLLETASPDRQLIDRSISCLSGEAGRTYSAESSSGYEEQPESRRSSSENDEPPAKRARVGDNPFWTPEQTPCHTPAQQQTPCHTPTACNSDDPASGGREASESSSNEQSSSSPKEQEQQSSSSPKESSSKQEQQSSSSPKESPASAEGVAEKSSSTKSIVESVLESVWESHSQNSAGSASEGGGGGSWEAFLGVGGAAQAEEIGDKNGGSFLDWFKSLPAGGSDGGAGAIGGE